MAALRVYATPITRAGRYTTLPDATSAFVAEQNGDHSAQVIACHSLAELMDRLETEAGQ